MSGHSKWSTIKRQKGANDAKRGQTFTKIANAISIAARLGGSGDPDANPRLRMVLDTARSVNLPKENVQRAIDRGLGRLPGQVLDEVIYEGFGPSKVAYLIEAVSDNRLRTTSEVRNLFERAGGSLGSSGVTAYLFDKKGQIKVKSKSDQIDNQTLELIDLGAEDVEALQENGIDEFLILTEPSELYSVSTKVTQSGFPLLSSEIVYIPNIHVEITDPEKARKVLDFTEKIEEYDDVQKVYANFDIPRELLVNSSYKSTEN